VPTFHGGQNHGERYTQGKHGIGPRKDDPYVHKTLENKIVGLKRVYVDAGVPEADNPVAHTDVSQTLRLLKVVLGSARARLPDAISPDVALRVIGSLDVRNTRDLRIALLLAQGMTLGERPSTLGMRDFREMCLDVNGVCIFTPYTKSDKEQEGEVTGIPHLVGCKKSCVTSEVDGVLRFVEAEFCAACVLPFYKQTLLEEFPGLTEEVLAGQPVFGEFVSPEGVPAGATVVKAKLGSNVDAGTVSLREGVFVITCEQEVAGTLYRGEPLDSLDTVLALARVGVEVEPLRASGLCAGAYVGDDAFDVEDDDDEEEEADATCAAGGGTHAVQDGNVLTEAPAGGVSVGDGRMCADAMASLAAAETDAVDLEHDERRAREGGAGASAPGASAGAAPGPRGSCVPGRKSGPHKHKSRRRAHAARGAYFEVTYDLGGQKSVFVKPWAVVRCAR
jgi:hypothetical protein